MMIEDVDWKFRLFILASPFCLSLIGLGVDLYIACTRHYRVMTTALQHSECLSYAICLWGEKSVKSRMLVIAMIAGELMFHTASIRRGSLNAQDYTHLPKRLRSKLVVGSWLNAIGFIWLMLNSLL